MKKRFLERLESGAKSLRDDEIREKYLQVGSDWLGYVFSHRDGIPKDDERLSEELSVNLQKFHEYTSDLIEVDRDRAGKYLDEVARWFPYPEPQYCADAPWTIGSQYFEEDALVYRLGKGLEDAGMFDRDFDKEDVEGLELTEQIKYRVEEITKTNEYVGDIYGEVALEFLTYLQPRLKTFGADLLDELIVFSKCLDSLKGYALKLLETGDELVATSYLNDVSNEFRSQRARIFLTPRTVAQHEDYQVFLSQDQE